LKDSLSVALYYMCVHKFLKCWKWNRKNIQNLKKFVVERVYCISDWQKRKDHWKCDCVLIQKWSENTETTLNTLNSQLFDRLQIIIFVTDFLWENNWNKLIQYTDVLVDLFKSLNKDCSHNIYDIIELSN